MTYDIVFAKQAINDLDSIFEYITYELASPISATRQIERLEAKIDGLHDLPFRYKRYFSERTNDNVIRVMPVDNYAVLFYPNRNTHQVTILRIIYSRRDLDRLLLTEE